MTAPLTAPWTAPLDGGPSPLSSAVTTESVDTVDVVDRVDGVDGVERGSGSTAMPSVFGISKKTPQFQSIDDFSAWNVGGISGGNTCWTTMAGVVGTDGITSGSGSAGF